MNIFDDFQGRIGRAVTALVASGAIPGAPALERIIVEPPRDASHGDLATNAAMVLAKDAKTSPRALAALIAAELRADPDVMAVVVAGPGFINLELRPAVFQRALAAVLAEGADYGRSNRGGGEAVNVEYVSANPTGPMHIGHGRGACFGDALAALLAFTGHAVTREYYINDSGAQVDVLGRSALLRYREALGETIGAIPEGFYPGDYLKPVGAALAARHGRALNQMPEAKSLPIARDAAITAMMAMIRGDLAGLGVEHAVFFSERSLARGATDEIAAVLADFRARDLVYQGRLPPPKGAPDKDWEDREQTLFRASRFGDDVDRPLLKSDGGYTYFAADIAYHRSKFLRGFDTMIDVWGADHGGYVKRLKAAVAAVSDGKATLDVKLCQLVRVVRDGVPVKMSKRSGEFVALADVVEEVGRDPVRFMMLFRKNDAPLDFDLVKVLEKSKENPVFYVQYAHARCCSAFRQAAEIWGEPPNATELAGADLTILVDPAEMEVAKKIAELPRVIDQAAVAHEPHRVAFYLHDLASVFHQLWNRGKEAPHLRFINQDDRKSSIARLALVEAVRIVLVTGLSLLGVSAPDEMR